MGLLCIYWFITQQMEKYDKIVIENGKAYGYKMIKLSNQFTCTYLAYLTDNSLLMERLKKLFPNTSVSFNTDYRIKSEWRYNGESLSGCVNTPLYDFTDLL